MLKRLWILCLLLLVSCVAPAKYYAINRIDADRAIERLKDQRLQVIKVIQHPNGMFEIQFKK